MTAAGMFLIGVALGLCCYAWLTAPDRRRARNNLAATEMERNYWRDKHHSEVSRFIREIHGPDNATYHLVRWEQEMGELS